MKAMGSPVHKNLCLGKTDEGQVADEVQELMAHRFILEPQRWIHPLITVADKGVVQCTALDQTSARSCSTCSRNPKVRADAISSTKRSGVSSRASC